jgi:hypothetical protein
VGVGITPDTPDGYRHARVQAIGRNRYAVRTWFVGCAWTRGDRQFLRVPGDVNLERLPLEEALRWAGHIERFLNDHAKIQKERR